MMANACRIGRPRRFGAAWAALLCALLVAAPAGAPEAGEGTLVPEGADTPAGVYARACASCHGTDGRGMPRAHVGFDVPLPDFTDCSFATREPDSDWFAVAHEGGPARAFDHRMPAFGEALGTGRLEMAVAHVRTFCPERGWPSGNLNLPRAMFTEKAFVEDEAVLTVGAAVQAPYAVTGRLVFEKRLGRRGQVEVVVPFGAVERPRTRTDAGGWGGGLGDLALGYKHVLAGFPSSGTIVSVLGEVVLPTGRKDLAMGGGRFLFEPALLLGQPLGPAGFVHFQGGAEVPLVEDGTPEVFWRLAYGYPFSQGPFGRSWTPMVEMLGWIEAARGETARWDLAPQLQVTLSTRQHIALCLATRIPLEPGNDRAIGVWAYLLWEWFDGGFLEGW